MVTIIYDKTSNPTPDSQAEQFVEEVIEAIRQGGTHLFARSNELLIYAVRAAVNQGRIDHTKIRFKCGGFIYPIDKFGYVSAWPNEFCNNIDKYLDILCGWGNLYDNKASRSNNKKSC
jgi:hypothetical protein